MELEFTNTRLQAQEEEIERLKQMVFEMRNLDVPRGPPASAQSGVAHGSTSVDHISASGGDSRARADEERAEDP